MYRNVNGVHTDYYYLGDKLVARKKGSAVTYIHTDYLGSPAAETNSSGTVTARMHYQPFGASIETPKDDVGYTGHKFDKDLGLSYMQARYYDPAIGRFYSNDPIGFRDVHSFNRYAYANNNPYKYTDPTGMAPCEGSSSRSCIQADPVNDKITSKPDVTASDKLSKVAVANKKKFAVKRGTKEKAGFIRGDKATEASDLVTGTTSKTFTAEFKVPSDADATIHGHPDSEANMDSPGDAAPALELGIPNFTVSKGRVGVTELVNGKIQFRMVRGKMTRKDSRALQKNLNKQQENYK